MMQAKHPTPAKIPTYADLGSNVEKPEKLIHLYDPGLTPNASGQVAITIHTFEYGKLPEFPLPPPPPGPEPKTLTELLALPSEEMVKVDIARMNLLCAEGLPGSENIDVDKMETTLDVWAKEVKKQTERVYPKFLDHPDMWDNSEAFFRASVLVYTLKDVFHVKYDPKYAIPDQIPDENQFFSDSKDAFLTGLLGPDAQGTCGTLPVLFVAVGRRLGYPMKFVETYNHGFARWESPDGKERFNIEGTGEGLSKRTDDFYKTWPHPLTDQMIQDRHYLQSMTPTEELSAFLRARVTTLKVANRLSEAWDAALAANRLAPTWDQNRIFLSQLYQLRNPGREESLQQSLDSPFQNTSNAPAQGLQVMGVPAELEGLLPPDVLRMMPKRPIMVPADPTPIAPTPTPGTYGNIPLPPGVAGVPGMNKMPRPYLLPNMPNSTPFGPNPAAAPFLPNPNAYQP